MIAAEATNAGLIGSLIGAITVAVPGYVGLRRYRSDRDNTDAQTKQLNADAAETIVDMATKQLASYERQITALQNDISQMRGDHAAQITQMRSEHAAQMLQVRAELRSMEENITRVLAENHELRAENVLLQSRQA